MYSETKYKLWKLYDKITHPFYFTYYYIRKIFRYAIFLWNDREYDWTYILRLLKFKLKLHRKQLIHHVGDEKERKRIRTCELLIDRIVNENYSDPPFMLKATVYEHHEYLINQDINYLFKTLSKYIRVWWD